MYRILAVFLFSSVFISSFAEDAQKAVPPREKIYFTRKSDHTSNLFSIKTDGSDLMQVTNFGDWEECLRPDFSPKSMKIIFIHSEKMTKGLSVLDLKTKKVTQIVKASFDEEVKGAAFSPDGKSIACLIGEGFDCKSLSTLFIATPIKFSGRVLQYLGRVLRPAPGKNKAVVYDYVDGAEAPE